MEEFQRQIGNGYIIERVNLSSATLLEATRFKRQLDTDIELGYKIIIIDFTECSVLDTAFIGVLVITLKKLLRSGGSIKIVKPGMFSNSLLNLTGTIEIFELHESIDHAIASVSLPSSKNNDFFPTGLDRLSLANQH